LEDELVTDWDRLVHEHGAAVFGTALRILGHRADTEEVVQDVFLEAYRLWRARPVKHWGGLLRRLAACRALDRVRRRKPSLALNAGLVGADPGPEAAAVGRELAERLRRVVATLPEREAAVFCLRCFDDLSYQEIAEALDINRGAVAQALHKAREKLQALFTQTGESAGNHQPASLAAVPDNLPA
jgi:RNA polymerase sigma-70 factor (ECF subfamily)